MPRVTKAELETQLEHMQNELTDLKQAVVKNAIAAGLRHGWCIELRKELKRLGLADLVPDGYVVQVKHTGSFSDQQWSQASDTIHRTARAAIAEARSEYLHFNYQFRLRKIDGNLRSTFTDLDSNFKPVEKPNASQRPSAASRTRG